MTMAATQFSCPRCLYTTPRDVDIRFCPRCGLPKDKLSDRLDRVNIAAHDGAIVVHDHLAFGHICNLYRCSFRGQKSIFKIARTHLANRFLVSEWDNLRRLHHADSQSRFSAFLPLPSAQVNYAHVNGEPARQATVLSYGEGIDGPDDLYSLEEVRTGHPNGIDERDMAWMWRRLLTVLGFIHQQRLAHCAVTPDHVLIEPREHKLVLVGWCGAVAFGRIPSLIPAQWRDWSDRHDGASSATDLSAAAKTMSYLLKSPAEPAIARHLERAGQSADDSWKLLDDFDRMIEALWGPRQFRPFVMPARS
jgi:hypothetical protein